MSPPVHRARSPSDPSSSVDIRSSSFEMPVARSNGGGIRVNVGGGVVRDPQLRAAAVQDVARAAAGSGLGVQGVTASPLPGPAGNVEYFLWLRQGAGPLDDAALCQAIAAGPQ